MVAKRNKPRPAARPKSVVPVLSNGVAVPQPPSVIDLLMMPSRVVSAEEVARKWPRWPEHGIDAADPALTLYFGKKAEEIEEPKVDRSVNLKIRELRGAGRSWKEIAKELRLPWPTTA